MKIELRNVKIAKHLSEETTAFTADLVANGRPVAKVRNDGQGGCHRYDALDRAALASVQEWAKTQPTEFDFEKLDQLVDRLVCRHDLAAWLTRQCRAKTMFRLRDEPAGAWRWVQRPYDAATAAFIRKKYGGRLAFIANENQDAAVDAELADPADVAALSATPPRRH